MQKLIESIDTTTPLKQGDFVRSKGREPWGRAGVVVTADCDIARSKHWGRVTVVPVETASVLCSTLLARAWLEKQRDALMNVLRIDYSGSGELVSRDHVELLVASRIKFSSQKSQIIADALVALDDSDEPKDLMGVIIAGNRLLPKPSNLRKWFGEKVFGLPGDLMAVPVPEWDGRRFGVAWLRALRHVKPQDIVSTTSDWYESRWIRAGRLAPEYRYRLTQQLASVFSDIGLPGHGEQDCREAFNVELSGLTLED